MRLSKSWAIVPCHKKSKKAVFDAWQDKASKDPKTICKWLKKYKGYNWGLLPSKSGLVVVDIDKDGMELWKSLCKKHGEPKTLKAISGSRGGLHYVFKHDGETKYRGKYKCDKGKLDIQYNNYILIAPSKIKKSYKWVEETKVYNVQPVPAWLLKLIEKKVSTKNKKADADEFDEEFFTNIAEQLADKDLDYSEWIDLGMALHHASGGAEEGLEIWLIITEGINHKDGDEELASNKYEGFDDEKEGGVTAGTFLKIAKDKKCKLGADFEPLNPNDFFKDETEETEPDDAEPEPGDKHTEPKRKKPNPEEWSKNSVTRRQYTDDMGELLNRLDYDGFSMLIGSKGGRIIQVFRDIYGYKDFGELDNKHLKNSVADYCLRDIDIGDGSKPQIKFIDADKCWFHSSDKRKYRGLIFQPENQKGMLNLWGRKAIQCKAVKGKVKLITEFIEHILCAGSKPKSSYLLQWLGHLVQKPHEKTAVVPVFIGVEGTGKGLITNGIMSRILKSRYTQVDTKEGIKNKFNKDLGFKFLINLDETCWSNDKDLMSILRARTGNPTVKIEEKFGAKFTINDYARYCLTANEPPVKLQVSNRRYLIFENSSKFIEHPIYDKIWTGLRNNQLAEKFYNYLLNVDIEEFNPPISSLSI